jgi:hypothetical protein
MARLLPVLALVLGLIFSSTLAVSAQIKDAAAPADDIDIPGIGELALDADTDALLEGLEEPPDDRDLPEGFFNPPSGVPANADVVEAFAIPVDELDGALGSFSHAFDTDGTVIAGLLSAGVINYIVVDAEITERELDDFEEGAAGGLDTGDEGLTGTVGRVDVAGQDAVVITVELEDAGIFGAVQVIALPVGNTLVIGTVVVADVGEVDADDVYDHAEALTLAGVSHVGEVAEDAA